MDDQRQCETRTVVGSVADKRPSALSVAVAIESLIAESSWDARLVQLSQQPALVDTSIARVCDARGETLLAKVIERAAVVGVATVASELPVALSLQRASSERFTDLDAAATSLRDAVQIVMKNSAFWMMNDATALAISISRSIQDSPTTDTAYERGKLSSLLLPAIAASQGCSPDRIKRVMDWARLSWEDVWSGLDDLYDGGDLVNVFNACPAAALVAEIAQPYPSPAERIADLCTLLHAAIERGPQAAIGEHRHILRITEELDRTGPADDEEIVLLAKFASSAGLYFKQTGALWILAAALRSARKAYKDCSKDNPRYLDIASDLGSLLGDAVQIGLVGKEGLKEAARCIEEAYLGTAAQAPNKARYASNLGSSLADLVRAGLAKPHRLLDAVDYLSEAYQSAPPGDPDRRQYASNLAAFLASAVRAGYLEEAKMLDAIAYLQEAYDGSADDPNLAVFAFNLGSRISEAVRMGLIDQTRLIDAIQHLEQAYRGTLISTDKVAFASGLGTVLSQAVSANLVPEERLGEALCYAEEAYGRAQEGNPEKDALGYSLSRILVDAVQAGLASPERLLESLKCQQDAFRRTPIDSPERLTYAASVGVLLGEAVQAGLVEQTRLLDAIEYQKYAYENTAPRASERATLASTLGNRLGEAVQAGLIGPERLLEAIAYQEEAYASAPVNSSQRASYASCLGNALGQAVGHGVVQPERLNDVINYQQEAYKATGVDNASRPIYASNLAEWLRDAVEAGQVDINRILEAIDYQEEAYRRTPANHPDRARYGSRLASLLSYAVEEGIAPLQTAASRMPELVDQMWKLVRAGVTPKHRRHILLASRDLTAVAPSLLLAGGYGCEDAARAIEAMRGHLAMGMQAAVLPSGLVKADLEAEYNLAATRYNLEQQRARESFADYSDAFPIARDLAAIVERVRATSPRAARFGERPDLNAIVQALTPDIAGIYLVPGSYSRNHSDEDNDESSRAQRLPGAAIIVRSDGSNELFKLPDLTSTDAAANARRLLKNGAGAAEVCSWLWKVAAEPLLTAASNESSLLYGVKEWVLVPTGHLGSLPWHGAGTSQTGWIDDHVCIRVAPSLLALVADAATEAPKCEGSPVVAVTSATDLVFLSADRAIAAALLRDAVPFVGEVTPDKLLNALIDAPTAIISGHAVHSLTEGGALSLKSSTTCLESATVDQWLTASDVDRLPLRRRDLVFLSACSSAQVAIDLPDETIGLPASFLHVGYRSVIATVWPVGDAIAFLTLARYLQLGTAQPSDAPAQLLRKVRTWLRTTTTAGFLAWLDDLTAHVTLPEPPLLRIRAWWAEYPDLSHPFPCADPEDWAAYACTSR